MPTKYEPLELPLRAIPAKTREVTIQFSELERILGAPLPEFAIDRGGLIKKPRKRGCKLMPGYRQVSSKRR